MYGGDQVYITLGKIFLFTGYRILFDKMQSISMCFVNFVNFVNF